MKDILGREVSRGDLIVYGITKGNFIKYSETRLGIVNNVLGQRTHLKGSYMYNKIFKDQLLTPANILYMPTSIDTIAKVTFYPLHLSDKHLGNPVLAGHKMHPNGKPVRGVLLTTTFLKFNVEDLTDDWSEAYVEARKAFRI